MRISSINVDKAIETAELGLKDLKSGDTPNECFHTSVEDLVTVTKVLLERLNRKKEGRKSSEKSDKNDDKSEDDDSIEKKKKRSVKKPSERYPDAPVIEKELDFEEAPTCECCGKEMEDSGLRETTEQLQVIPKKHIIYRILRKKYNCRGCHTGMKTPTMPPRIVPGSSYGDSMVLDVALSKYCDLLPIERYVQMAARMGFDGLPPQSLIALTHYLANFLRPIYEEMKKEVLSSKVIHADETPHKMLEGDKEKKTYYLWGFSTLISCFFDIRNTRSGSVADEYLKASKCEYLVSDVFSGYAKAVRLTNAYRKSLKLALILHAYCNAHARRKFKHSEDNFPEESKVFIANYREIYCLENEVKKVSSYEEKLSLRQKMRPFFEIMKGEGEKLISKCSEHFSLAKAINYFLKNFIGLTRCLDGPDIPLDNNGQERLLRPHVVGRKTWYGTHSKKGARTAAKLFTIVEGCKLVGINPREYFPYVVESIHLGKEPPTPYKYSQMQKKSGIPPD